MRRTQGGIPHVAAIIEEDLEQRDMRVEIANVLPRDVKSDEERYRYIQYWLANHSIDPIRATQGVVPDKLNFGFFKLSLAELWFDQV